MAEFIAWLVIAGGLVALLASLSILNGFVLTILWDWFIVPTFHLVSLTIPQAIGLGIVVSFLTYHYKKGDDPDWKAGLLRYPIILFVGWIVHLFM